MNLNLLEMEVELLHNNVRSPSQSTKPSETNGIRILPKAAKKRTNIGLLPNMTEKIP
jgi:hypothetical protein